MCSRAFGALPKFPQHLPLYGKLRLSSRGLLFWPQDHGQPECRSSQMCWRVIPEAARDHWWMKRWWSGGSVWQLSHPRSGLTRRHILQCSRGKVPPQDWAPAAHTGNRLDNTHFISSIPSLSHFPTPLQAFPGIISQINYL